MRMLRFFVFILAGTIISCGGTSSSPAISHSDQISDCKSNSSAAVRDMEEMECNEMLYWTYNETDNTLTLLDENVLLNCCGQHSFSVTEKDTAVEVTEIDTPDFMDARCACMCRFDYSTVLGGIEGTSFNLILKRYVKEEGETTVWAGTLDLSSGNGNILIKDRTGEYCW